MSLIKHAKNTDSNWGWVMITLHWLLVLPIIGLFALGLYMTDLGYYDSFYTLAPQIHEAVGLVVLILMIFRVVWRLTNRTPKSPKTNTRLINTVSHIAHNLLYALLFTILFSGLLISYAGGQGIQIFDWFVLSGPAELFDNQATYAGEVHYFSAFALIGLVILHSAAALKHHFIEKDSTLTNMLGIKEKQ